MRHLPDQAVNCLACACLNRDNVIAAELLLAAQAATATGVVAAIFTATNHDHCEVASLARRAISEQRNWCRQHGPFRAAECRRLEVTDIAAPSAADEAVGDACLC